MGYRAELLGLFQRQYGVVDAAQLVAHGVAERTIRSHLARGLLVKVLPGVFRLASAPDTFQARAMAVQLHTAPFGFLMGPTAAHIRGLRSMPVHLIYVTVWWRSRSAMPSWVRRHGTSWLDESDVELVHGFRVERPLPMLLSLGDTFNQFRFDKAAEDAWHLKLVTPEEAETFLSAVRRQGRHGVSVMEKWLAKTGVRTRAVQSNFEMDVLAAVRSAGLPEPTLQHPVVLRSGETVHLDLAWPEVMLGVEPGHSWWHGGDLKMRADHARDRACTAVGWEIMRYDEDARSNLAVVGQEILDTYRTRQRLFGVG